MPGVLLGRPLLTFAGLPDEDIASGTMDDFFQAGWRSPQAHTQVRMLLHWKGEVEFPFKPDWWSIHVLIR